MSDDPHDDDRNDELPDDPGEPGSDAPAKGVIEPDAEDPPEPSEHG
jgi:hypothetical protein